MRGGRKRAKPACGRPLDGRVRLRPLATARRDGVRQLFVTYCSHSGPMLAGQPCRPALVAGNEAHCCPAAFAKLLHGRHAHDSPTTRRDRGGRLNQDLGGTTAVDEDTSPRQPAGALAAGGRTAPAELGRRLLGANSAARRPPTDGRPSRAVTSLRPPGLCADLQ